MNIQHSAPSTTASDTQVERGPPLQHVDKLMAQALTDACSVAGPLVSGHIMKSNIRRLLCSVGTQAKSKDAQLRSQSESRRLGTIRNRVHAPHGSVKKHRDTIWLDRTKSTSTTSTKGCRIWTLWTLSTSDRHSRHSLPALRAWCTRHDCNAKFLPPMCGTVRDPAQWL